MVCSGRKVILQEGQKVTDIDESYDKAETIARIVNLSDKSIYRLAKKDPTSPA